VVRVGACQINRAHRHATTRVDRDHRLPALIDRAGSAELLADVDPDHDTAVGVGLTTR
jgi:hypothetical protein